MPYIASHLINLEVCNIIDIKLHDLATQEDLYIGDSYTQIFNELTKRYYGMRPTTRQFDNMVIPLKDPGYQFIRRKSHS